VFTRRFATYNPSPKKKAQHPIFGPCLLWPNGRTSQLLLSTYTNDRPRTILQTVTQKLSACLIWFQLNSVNYFLGDRL